MCTSSTYTRIAYSRGICILPVHPRTRRGSSRSDFYNSEQMFGLLLEIAWLCVCVCVCVRKRCINTRTATVVGTQNDRYNSSLVGTPAVIIDGVHIATIYTATYSPGRIYPYLLTKITQLLLPRNSSGSPHCQPPHSCQLHISPSLSPKTVAAGRQSPTIYHPPWLPMPCVRVCV